MNTCACSQRGANEVGREEVERLAGIFKALGHPVRLRLALMLQGGERCVCELHEGTERDISTISNHLSILKRSGVLCSEQRGKNIYYRLSCPCLNEVISCFATL